MFASSMRYIFDAVRFMRFIENNANSNSFEKCIWPIVAVDAVMRDEGGGRQTSEGEHD